MWDCYQCKQMSTIYGNFYGMMSPLSKTGNTINFFVENDVSKNDNMWSASFVHSTSRIFIAIWRQ